MNVFPASWRRFSVAHAALVVVLLAPRAAMSHAPVVVNNTGSSLAEGGIDIIRPEELYYDDGDITTAFDVTTPPVNGHLAYRWASATPIHDFFLAEMVDGDVVYVHDDSNTTTDQFTFTVFHTNILLLTTQDDSSLPNLLQKETSVH